MATSKKPQPSAEQAPGPKGKVPAYVVVSAFQDAREYQTTPKPTKYLVGDDVSHLDPARLEKLIARGLVKHISE